MRDRQRLLRRRRLDRSGSVGKRNAGNARATPQAAALVHPVVHMQDELRRRAGDPFAMRYVIERPLEFRMLGDIFANFVQALARGLQTLFELSLRFYLGLAQRHLHTAVRVDLSLTRGLDGKENHVLELVDDGGLNTIGLR